MEPGQQENEFADDMRGWAANQKISGKTVDLLIKDGFDSMEALILIDSNDLSQTKIQRGQQKLLLKALLSLTSSGEETGSAAATGRDNTPATGIRDLADGTTIAGGDNTQATGTRDGADITIAGTQGTNADGIQRDDVYTRLMADHMRAMQSGPATSGNAQNSADTQCGETTWETHSDVSEQCQICTGSWQDPQLHLRSSASGRSAHAYHDIVDFVGKDTMEETVVAGMHEGRQVIIKSGVKPKLESLTLSKWSIANLAILYTLVGEGKLEGGGDMLDYLSYTPVPRRFISSPSVTKMYRYISTTGSIVNCRPKNLDGRPSRPSIPVSTPGHPGSSR